MKKIINDVEAFVDEVIEGILLAHPDALRAATGDKRALVRRDAGTKGRVGIVTGGGSGHLPLFLGYVGQGLASGVAVGNVFSSPSAQQIYAATKASDAGAGVLYLYGNYGGDVYNFDIAGDLAANDGIKTTTVLGNDDILSAPEERAETRRGVAGLFFAYKTAGAAAERGADLETVTAVAQKTVDRVRTMGVGLAPTILPAAGEPTFELADGEMEIGVGIHGEPGKHRGPLESANQITDRFLTEILQELKLSSGDRVAVLVNGLGATPPEELYLIYRRTHQVLAERGVEIHRRYIGEYVTSLEMAGASLSILHLDDDLAELIDAPAWSPFFEQNSGGAPQVSPDAPAADLDTAAPQVEREIRRVPHPGKLRDVVLNVTEKLPAHADELRDLDAAIGDGDLGVTISAGAEVVRAAVRELPADAHPSEILHAAGAAFAVANPSTYAALLGGGLMAAGEALTASEELDVADIRVALAAMQERVMERGGAQIGDKTVVDVLAAVGSALEGVTDQNDAARRAVAAAQTTVEAGKDRSSQRGRAGWLGERTIGHRDPGSVAFVRLLEQIESYMLPR